MPHFQLLLALSCVLGMAVNHSTFVCTRQTSPLTTSVAGSIKNIVMTIVGAFAFGDFIYHPINVVGVIISMLGAVW